jgi:hypothetical protein
MFGQNVTSHLLTSFIFKRNLQLMHLWPLQYDEWGPDECTFLWEDSISLWPGD